MKFPKIMSFIISLALASVLASGSILPACLAVDSGGSNEGHEKSQEGSGGSLGFGEGEGSGEAQGSGEATADTASVPPLYEYAESLSRGVALDPGKDASRREWRLLGAGDSDSETEYVFELIENDDGELVLHYIEKDDDGENIGSPIAVYLEPYDDGNAGDGEDGGGDADNSGAAGSEDNSGDGEDGENGDGAKMIELLYIDKFSNPSKSTALVGSSGLLASVEGFKLGDDDEHIIPHLVWIPEGFLILYSDYESARDAFLALPEIDDEPQSDDIELPEQPQGDNADEHLRALLESLFGDDELREFERDGDARIVIDVSFDNKAKEWSLSDDPEDSVHVYSANFEMADTTNNNYIFIGVIVLLAAAACSLAMNIVLIVKKSRR